MNILENYRLIESKVGDGVEVIATTSEQIDNIKSYIKGLNIKSIRTMYSVLEGFGFAVSFSKSLFSPDIDSDTFKGWLKPFKALQTRLAIYGLCKRRAVESGDADDIKAMTDSKSECFDELKALKTWLGVKVNCKATDIDTLEAHCFKYARANREAIAEGWTVKPVSIYQFINFCFKELNFGESKTECALTYAQKAIKQAVLDDTAETYKKLTDSKSAEQAEPAKKPAKKATKKTAGKVAKAEPEATEAEPVKA